jgi:hypothetical protein
MDLDAAKIGYAESLQSRSDQLFPVKGCSTSNSKRRMGLNLEKRECAFFLCDEVFLVTNQRKIFCCDRCRARQYAFEKGDEKDMFRHYHNRIIDNYRILKSLVLGKTYTFLDLLLLKYKFSTCSQYKRDIENESQVTMWCYDLGLKSQESGDYIVVQKNTILLPK